MRRGPVSIQGAAGVIAERVIGRNDGCLIYQDSPSQRYGHIRVSGKKMATHKVVFEATHGLIPVGMEVCHVCDTPKCCNPKHLFLATHRQNMADMAKKGRQLRGEVQCFGGFGSQDSSKQTLERSLICVG